MCSAPRRIFCVAAVKRMAICCKTVYFGGALNRDEQGLYYGAGRIKIKKRFPRR